MVCVSMSKEEHLQSAGGLPGSVLTESGNGQESC